MSRVPASPRLATVYSASEFSLAARKMGRQSASGGLLRALIASEPHEVFRVLTLNDGHDEELQALLAARPELRLEAQPLLQRTPPAGVDLLLMSDPLLGRLAHWRQWQAGGARAYGLIGITHTLCSLPVLEGLRELATAPVQPWDALICTSRCAREAVSISLDWEEERLRRRFAAPSLRLPRPRLPLIPLGCDVDRLAGLTRQRDQARQALGIADDQVVLLFVGRLAMHAKAHPTALLEALARLAARRPASQPPVRLLLYGTLPPGQGPVLRQALETLVRGYQVQVLNGEDESLADRVWAAADIFVSLADNHQETFGLTPVEAMACGLPVLASDWNGYRDTVLHGETGLLVPTAQPAEGLEVELARYALRHLDYDAYVGRLMQEVVIDPEALLAALERLVTQGDLRRRLGQAGRRRAAEHYDWSRIGARLRDLATSLELARHRAAGAGETDLPLPPPQWQFGSWASRVLTASSPLRGDPAAARERWRRLAPLGIHNFPEGLGCDPGQCELLLRRLEQGSFSLAQLSLEQPDLDAAGLRHAAHWLAKLGVVDMGH